MGHVSARRFRKKGPLTHMKLYADAVQARVPSHRECSFNVQKWN